MFQPCLSHATDNHLLSSVLSNLFQYESKLSILPQIFLLAQVNFMDLYPLTSENH